TPGLLLSCHITKWLTSFVTLSRYCSLAIHGPGVCFVFMALGVDGFLCIGFGNGQAVNPERRHFVRWQWPQFRKHLPCKLKLPFLGPCLMLFPAFPAFQALRQCLMLWRERCNGEFVIHFPVTMNLRVVRATGTSFANMLGCFGLGNVHVIR